MIVGVVCYGVVMDTVSTHGQLSTRPCVVVIAVLGHALLGRVFKLDELGGCKEALC